MPRRAAIPSEVAGTAAREGEEPAGSPPRHSFLEVTAADLARVPLHQLRQMAADIDGLKRRILRASEDELAALERSLIDAIDDEWSGRIPGAIDAVLADLATGIAAGTFGEGDLARVLEAARGVLLAGFVDKVVGAVGSAIGGSYGVGREAVLKPLQMGVSLNLVDEHAQKVLTGDTMFWVGSAWDRVLGKVIADTVREQVIEQGLSRIEAGAELQRIFGDEFPGKSRAYWETVAAAGVVRARSFGSVESFVQAEAETYIILEVNDARTCELCAYMNAREFRVSSAVRQRDAFLAAENPEAAKAIHPWTTYEAVKGKSTEELDAAGLTLPPYHGRCRGTVVVGRMAGD